MVKRGKHLMGFCPFHDSSNDPVETLTVYKDEYYCTKCEISGDYRHFLSHWHKLKSIDSRSERQKKWQEKKEQDRAQKEDRKKSISAIELDVQIRHILAQLELSNQHRWHLRKKYGLTDEQIKAGKYKTVHTFQNLNQAVDDRVGGVTIGGKLLLTKTEVILYPVADCNWNFITWKHEFVPIDTESFKNNEPIKITWTTPSRFFGTQHKLEVHQPKTTKTPNKVLLCDGISQTLHIASDRLNLPVIGAENGHFAKYPDTLRLYLKNLKAKTVILCPAPGAIYSQKLFSYYKTIQLIEKTGRKVEILWWNQTSKSDPHIDRITEDQLNAAQYLKPAEFRSIAARERARREDWETWREKKRFSADVNIDRPYFEHSLPDGNKLIFIKSPLGSGKTTQLIGWLKEWGKLGKGAISLGYRNTLLLQFCEKANQPNPETGEKGSGFYHVHEDTDAAIFIKDAAGNIAACINSILKFRPEDFDGKIIIIDEVVSVIKHLLYSGTVRNFSDVIDRFEEAIRRADRVICLDGFMANWIVDYFGAICPEKDILRIANHYSGSKAPVHFLEGTWDIESEKVKKNDRTPWLDLLLNEAEIPAICSDSQIFIESMDDLLSDKGVKTLRADSKTANTKAVNEFLKDPEGYILRNKIEAILYTPTAESGLDIKITNYFTHHFAFFFGVLDVDSILQMIGRIRDMNVPRYIWVRPFVSEDFPNIPEKESNVTKLKAARFGNMMAELAKIQGSDANAEQKVKAIELIYHQNCDAHCTAADLIKSIWNFEKPNLRECVKETLIANGYQLKSIIKRDFESSELFKEIETEAKEGVKLQNSSDIFNASDRRLNDPDLSLKFDASWEKRCEVLKARIVRLLPAINESEIWSPEFIKFVKYDRPNLIKQLEKFYLLQNPEIAQKTAQESYHRIFERHNKGQRIPPWKLRYQYLQISTLIEIGLLSIINNPTMLYTADHPVIESICSECKREEISRVIGKHHKDKMKYIRRIHRSLGLDWTKTSRMIDGNKD
ncbi:MAG: plasmid replication protein, CyRepA1 family, partial [Prochloraceae cyanobacterium]